MRVFILAAGEGTRLWPFTTIIPKCMLPIKGVPCARVIVDRIRASFKDEADSLEFVICCLDRDFWMFFHEFRDIPNVVISTSEAPLGTASQVMHAISEKKMLDDEDVMMVHYGDCLVGIDYKELANTYKYNGSQATLVGTENVRSPYGQIIIEWTRGGKNIVAFNEKPMLTGITWTGVAMVNVKDLQKLATTDSDFGKNIFPDMIRSEGLVVAYITDKEYFDIGDIQSYLKVNKLAMKQELFAR